ncbi:MAG: hypothetical protein LBN22_01500 [Clostridiales Family XIII bacterium]|nr:hypothetical protein [Clostridiales Family XIII bacterium]
MRIDNTHKREYYELESLNNGWMGRELERQINSGLYERLTNYIYLRRKLCWQNLIVNVR